jgi:endonuclease/exonuclease/phosphatase (EEP) superfamily protein YafD
VVRVSAPRRRAAAARLLAVAMLGLGAVSLAGFAGERHWALDLLSHFRPQYALLLAAALFVGWAAGVAAWVAGLTAACLAVQVGTLLPFWLPPREVAAAGPRVRVCLLNVYTGSRAYAAVRALLLREDPDLVVLQETDAAWLEGLADVRARYPHRIEEPRADNFGIALWSRLDLDDPRIVRFDASRVPSVVTGVRRDGAAFTLIATHPLPPAGAARAARRDEALAAVARCAAAQGGAVAVVGDLNCSPWSPHFRRLLAAGRLLDSAEGRGLHATWPARLGPLGIPIDHFLHGAALAVAGRRVGPRVGSDHRPLVVELRFPGE